MGWLAAAGKIQEELTSTKWKKEASEVPTLLLWTDGDTCLDGSELPKLVDGISKDVKIKCIPNCRHDMLLSYTEEDNKIVMDSIFDFLVEALDKKFNPIKSTGEWARYCAVKADDPKKRALNVNDATRLFRACWVAYQDKTTLGRVRAEKAAESGFISEHGMEVTLAQGMGGVWPTMSLVKNGYQEFKNTDTEAYIAKTADGTQLVMGCRGSTSPCDWMNNLKAVDTAWEPNRDGEDNGGLLDMAFEKAQELLGNHDEEAKTQGKVHRGFYTAFLPLKKMIKEVLLPELKGVKELSFVGHSLGGALATQCFVYTMMECDLAELGIKVNCFTVGQPRVGNEQFRIFLRQQAAKLRKHKLLRHYRVHLGSDIVPSVPPAFQGWVHVGRVAKIDVDEDGHVRNIFFKGDGVDNNKMEASEVIGLDGLWKPPQSIQGIADLILDHGPPAYNKGLGIKQKAQLYHQSSGKTEIIPQGQSVETQMQS